MPFCRPATETWSSGKGVSKYMHTKVAPQKRRVQWTPYLFLIVPMAIYLVFMIFPTLYSLFISLFQWDGLTNERTFVGLDNYLNLFQSDPVFRTAVKNNVIWAVLSEIIPICLGMALAVLLNSKKRGFGFFRSCIFFPSVLSISTIGLIWRWMYDPNFGLINGMLKAATNNTVSINWQDPPEYTIYFLIIAGSWAYSGLCMILFMAGIKSVPETTLEAALLDGANGWQRLTKVILPQMKNTINIVLTFTLINSFKVFDLIYVMTAGGPARMTNVMATWSYYTIFRYNDYGSGSAMCIVLSAILVAGSLVINKLVRMEKN